MTNTNIELSQILKSGPLSLSSKECHLFKGNEVNLFCRGIEFNDSCRVVVKSDTKILTVQLPYGDEERALTLKAKTTENLYEWKTALKKAFEQAPSAANATEQNGIFENDETDSIDISLDQ